MDFISLFSSTCKEAAMKKDKKDVYGRAEPDTRRLIEQIAQIPKNEPDIYGQIKDSLLCSDLSDSEKAKRLALLRYLCGKPASNAFEAHGEKIYADAAETLHDITEETAAKAAMEAFHRYLLGTGHGRAVELCQLYRQAEKQIRYSPTEAQRKWEELAFLCYICGKKFPPYPEELQRERLEERKRMEEERKAERLETQRKLREIEEAYRKFRCDPRAFEKPGYRRRNKR